MRNWGDVVKCDGVKKTTRGQEVARRTCGCVRGEICCPEGQCLFVLLEESFREAVRTGDWKKFDDLRFQYEEHCSTKGALFP